MGAVLNTAYSNGAPLLNPKLSSYFSHLHVFHKRRFCEPSKVTVTPWRHSWP